ATSIRRAAIRTAPVRSSGRPPCLPAGSWVSRCQSRQARRPAATTFSKVFTALPFQRFAQPATLHLFTRPLPKLSTHAELQTRRTRVVTNASQKRVSTRNVGAADQPHSSVVGKHPM